MEFEVVGWPPDGPTLDLPWREFSYAGKFVMTNTGKAVLRENGQLLGALSFNEDRTDGDVAWIRYISVRKDRRGDAIGSRLARATCGMLLEDGYRAVRIAVNNPFAYESMYKAGFGFTGEETGVAEFVLERPPPDVEDGYAAGLEQFLERDLAPKEATFVQEKLERGPPDTVKDMG
jgi:GNAT superfamily N-acetyltransferase